MIYWIWWKSTPGNRYIQELPDQPGDVPYTCADKGRDYRIPSIAPFEEEARRTVEWYQTAYELPQPVPETQNQCHGLSSESREPFEQPTELEERRLLSSNY
jgi:UDP-glucuronate 4-epimerase